MFNYFRRLKQRYNDPFSDARMSKFLHDIASPDLLRNASILSCHFVHSSWKALTKNNSMFKFSSSTLSQPKTATTIMPVVWPSSTMQTVGHDPKRWKSAVYDSWQATQNHSPLFIVLFPVFYQFGNDPVRVPRPARLLYPFKINGFPNPISCQLHSQYHDRKLAHQHVPGPHSLCTVPQHHAYLCFRWKIRGACGEEDLGGTLQKGSYSGKPLSPCPKPSFSPTAKQPPIFMTAPCATMHTYVDQFLKNRTERLSDSRRCQVTAYHSPLALLVLAIIPFSNNKNIEVYRSCTEDANKGAGKALHCWSSEYVSSRKRILPGQ